MICTGMICNIKILPWKCRAIEKKNNFIAWPSSFVSSHRLKGPEKMYLLSRARKQISLLVSLSLFKNLHQVCWSLSTEYCRPLSSFLSTLGQSYRSLKTMSVGQLRCPICIYVCKEHAASDDSRVVSSSYRDLYSLNWAGRDWAEAPEG